MKHPSEIVPRLFQAGHATFLMATDKGAERSRSRKMARNRIREMFVFPTGCMKGPLEEIPNTARLVLADIFFLEIAAHASLESERELDETVRISTEEDILARASRRDARLNSSKRVLQETALSLLGRTKPA